MQKKKKKKECIKINCRQLERIVFLSHNNHDITWQQLKEVLEEVAATQ